MSRKVHRGPIDEWIKKNDPNGLLELAKRSGVSHFTISRMRNGQAPKKYVTRRLICEALGVAEDTVFPVVTSDEGQAS